MLLSETYEFLYILAGKVSVSLLHDVGGDLGEIFVASAYSCFNFFVVESVPGLVFDKLDLFFEFFKEGLKTDGKTIPSPFALSHEVLVLLLKGFFVEDGVTMLFVILIELSPVFFLAVLLAMA